MRRLINGWSVRWDEEHARSARARGWWPDETIATSALRSAAANPGRIVIIDRIRRLSAGALVGEARQLAGAFMARGYQPGDVVSFMLPNWHEACVIYLAATFAGLVAHPLVPAYREAEVSFMLRDSRSRMIFIPEQFRKFDYPSMMRHINERLYHPPEIVVVRGDAHEFTRYADMIATGALDLPMPEVDPDSVRMVLYTSGTTGRPKGVLHTHNSIGADIIQISQHWRAGPGDRFFIPSPVSHIGGSMYAFEFPLMFETSAVLLDVWDADQAVMLIEAENCTHTAAATPFLQQILATARTRETRLPNLKVFICGGASVPPSLIREAADWFADCIVTRVYGSTEVPTLTIGSMSKADIDHAAQTDGAIGFAQVRLVAPNGSRSSDHGEVCARGPQMLVGYLHEEDERDAFDPDGFFRMGDLACMIDNHYLEISGRIKDIIIRQGENISPKEIEDVLIGHPDIADVAIIGLPNPLTGEMACAVIVPRAGKTPDVTAIYQFLDARHIARFKFPERVELRAELPRNAAGKILKHVLRADIIALSV